MKKLFILVVLIFGILFNFSGCAKAPVPAITKIKTNNKNVVHMSFKNRLYPGYFSSNNIKIYYDNRSNTILFFSRGALHDYGYDDNYVAQNGPNSNSLLSEVDQQKKILNRAQQIKNYSELEKYGIYMFHLSRGTSGDPIWGTTNDITTSYYYILNHEKVSKSKEIAELIDAKIQLPKKYIYHYAFLAENNPLLLRKLFQNNIAYNKKIKSLIEETYNNGYIESTKYLVKRFNTIPKKVLRKAFLDKDKNFINYVKNSVPNYKDGKLEKILYNSNLGGFLLYSCKAVDPENLDMLNKCLIIFKELFPKSHYIQNIKNSIYLTKKEKREIKKAAKDYEKMIKDEENGFLYIPSRKECGKYYVQNKLCYLHDFYVASKICKKSGGSIPHVQTLKYFAKKFGAEALDIDIKQKIKYFAIGAGESPSVFDFIDMDSYGLSYIPYGVICVHK